MTDDVADVTVHDVVPISTILLPNIFASKPEPVILIEF